MLNFLLSDLAQVMVLSFRFLSWESQHHLAHLPQRVTAEIPMGRGIRNKFKQQKATQVLVATSGHSYEQRSNRYDRVKRKDANR